MFAFADHGEARITIDGAERAHAVLAEIRSLGDIDLEQVTDTLLEEGVQSFADAFSTLLDGIASKRTTVVGS